MPETENERCGRDEIDIMIPQDPNLLYSYLNMKLRDFYPSLEGLCEDMDIDQTALMAGLEAAGYTYDAEHNRITAIQDET